MSWNAGNPINASNPPGNVPEVLRAMIEARRISYANRLGVNAAHVNLTYYYMTEASARTAVANKNFGDLLRLESEQSPDQPPGACATHGLNWFVAVLYTSAPLEVVSWGRAICG